MSGPATEELEFRRLVGEGYQFLWAFNHSSAPADATISLRVPWVLGQVKDVEKDERVQFREEQGKVVLEKRLAAGEIGVVRLGRRQASYSATAGSAAEATPVREP